MSSHHVSSPIAPCELPDSSTASLFNSLASNIIPTPTPEQEACVYSAEQEAEAEGYCERHPSQHPSITIVGHPASADRAAIEAELDSKDRSRRMEKRGDNPATANDDSADEQIMKVLSMRKLLLFQQHLASDNQPVLIIPKLYLGSVGASHHLFNLQTAGITHVLSVGRNLTQPFTQHFRYMYVPMLDSSTTTIEQHIWEQSWAFVDDARQQGAVLIHCFAGKSRSVTILLSYLMYRERMSLQDAWQHVKARRQAIAPNAGFLRQLAELEKALGVGNGVVPRII